MRYVICITYLLRYVTEEETANEAAAVIPGRDTEGLN